MRLLNNCFIVGIVALLASCSGDDIEPGSGSSRLPILLTTGSTTTRAAGNLLQGNFPSGSKITVLVDDNEYQYETNNDGKAMTCLSESHPEFPGNGNSVTIKAFYPYWKDWYRYNGDWTWCVPQDQSEDKPYTDRDLMCAEVSSSWNGLDANGKVKPTNEMVPLTFRHLLSKIIVNVTPTEGSSSKIKQVALNSLCDYYWFNPSTYLVDRAYSKTSPNPDILIYKNDNGTNDCITCAAVIPPQTKASGENFITVTMSDGTRYYQLPQSTTFESGSVYEYNIGTTRQGKNDMITLSDTLFTYNKSAQGPTITLKYGSTTLKEGTDYDFDTSTKKSATDAGTYTVKVNFKGHYSGSAQRTWTIQKASPTLSAPSSIYTLRGDGTSKALVTAGSTSCGTMQYCLGTDKAADGNWSESIPKATAEGKYYVWYRVKGNNNYKDSDPQGPRKAWIRKKPGQVICSDGWIGEYKDRGSRTPVAVVVKWGDDTGSSEYKNGLALALKDAGNGSYYKWSTETVLRNPVQFPTKNIDSDSAIEFGGNYTASPYNTSKYPAFKAAIENNGTAAPSNSALKNSGWFLPTMWQFNQVIWYMGSNSDERYNNLKDMFSACGGTNMKSGKYLMASEQDKDNCFYAGFDTNTWNTISKTSSCYVRAMLAF